MVQGRSNPLSPISDNVVRLDMPPQFWPVRSNMT
jgi:hypothetical protein